MSYEAMHKVRGSGLTDRTQVDVLEALAFFLNQETGACFPSTESISRISRVNDRLVRTTLKTLHELGYVSSTQTPGQKRYFTLHLDNLPVAEPLHECTPLHDSTPPNKSTPLHKTTPLHESTGEGCIKVQYPPVEKCSTPLYENTPEQGINKEYNKINNKVCETTLTPSLENLVPDVLENGDTSKKAVSPKKKGTRLTIDALSDDWRKYCEEHAPDIDAQKAFEDFHDYWVGVPGAKGVKLDWFATWRNYLRGMPEWKRKNFVKQSKPTGRLKTTSDEYLEIYRRGCKYDPNSEPSPTDADGFVAF